MLSFATGIYRVKRRDLVRSGIDLTAHFARLPAQ
jgi:hypothetical protein